jgi:hypothetical protein
MIESRTAIIINILRKSFNDFSKRSEDDEVKRFVVGRNWTAGI